MRIFLRLRFIMFGLADFDERQSCMCILVSYFLIFFLSLGRSLLRIVWLCVKRTASLKMHRCMKNSLWIFHCEHKITTYITNYFYAFKTLVRILFFTKLKCVRVCAYVFLYFFGCSPVRDISSSLRMTTTHFNKKPIRFGANAFFISFITFWGRGCRESDLIVTQTVFIIMSLNDTIVNVRYSNLMSSVSSLLFLLPNKSLSLQIYRNRVSFLFYKKKRSNSRVCRHLSIDFFDWRTMWKFHESFGSVDMITNVRCSLDFVL